MIQLTKDKKDKHRPVNKQMDKTELTCLSFNCEKFLTLSYF